MAAVTMMLTFETDPIYDALDTVARARDALFSRHGERFRAVQRDIEALAYADRTALADVQFHDLGEGIFVATALKALTDLVARARSLGVI